MNNIQLGVGPMSQEIISAINLYNGPLMVVASRNQVDYNSGYVCTSRELTDNLNSKILLCRDHCGPYFSDRDKKLTLSEALEECKKTIYEDIKSRFNLIHIDVSRIEHHQLEYAEELIEYALNIDSTVQFEFGSEDNTGEGLEPSLIRIDEQLKFISKYDNVKFFVTQTGSFTQHKQMGDFDVDRNKRIVDKVHYAGFLFKEHNADYLTEADISKRKIAGIDAVNIAPQLGTIQTRILKSISNNSKEWYEFAKRVYDSNLWAKWLPKDVHNKDLAVIVAGHYLFNTIEYKRLLNTIDRELYNNTIKKEIFSIFDLYTGNLL